MGMTARTATHLLPLLLLITCPWSISSHILDHTNYQHQNQYPQLSNRQQTLPGGNIPCTCARGQRVRKEYGSLTQSEFTAFVNAFKALKNTADGNSIFEQFVNLHRTQANEVHGTPQFLPWHREYLFQVECRLRQIDPSVTIPYWDWSIDSNDPASSSLWDLIGGARPGQSIPNEPFRDWSSSVPRQHNIIRGFDSRVPGSGFDWPLENEGTIRNLQGDGSLSYSTFADALEFFHGAPHVGIGGRRFRGDMALVDRSPNDPSFFFHHAFIDKIWGEWQKLPGKSREYNGFHQGRPVSLSDTIRPWSGTVADMFARDECVTYEQPTRSGVPSSLRWNIRRHRQHVMQKLAIHQGESDENTGNDDDSAPLPTDENTGNDDDSAPLPTDENTGNDDDSAPLPTNIPKPLAEKAKESSVVQDALEEADEDEVDKLSKAKPNRVEAIAKRIKKNHGMDFWARENGYPREKAELAKKVAAKEDPSVDYNEVKDGKPPGE